MLRLLIVRPAVASVTATASSNCSVKDPVTTGVGGGVGVGKKFEAEKLYVFVTTAACTGAETVHIIRDANNALDFNDIITPV